MHSSSWPLARLGALGIPCYAVQWRSFQERGWVVLCFRHRLCGEDSGTPLLLGLRASLYRPNQRETIAVGNCYILCGRSGVPGLLGWRIAMRAVPIAAGCSMKEGSTISVSFWLRMPLSRGCWLSVTERSVLCPLSSVHSCCRSVSSL